MCDMNVSIAMTTYNGEKYIKEQLNSILVQLLENDEIVISDDGSSDNTLNILNEFSRDKRIKIFRNDRLGFVKNFEFAINKCENDIIFISDQDDIWFDNKINMVKETFKNKKCSLVQHNGYKYYSGNKINNDILIKNMGHGIFKNIIKSSYCGSCMAFKKDFRISFSPFPKNLDAYDQWIGLIAEKEKTSVFIDDVLIFHRLHENNVTKKLPFIKKIIFRLNLMFNYVHFFIVKKSSRIK